jgi:hypothetical protein
MIIRVLHDKRDISSILEKQTVDDPTPLKSSTTAPFTFVRMSVPGRPLLG